MTIKKPGPHRICCAVRGDCVCGLDEHHDGPHLCLNKRCLARWTFSTRRLASAHPVYGDD